jgi:hypothetical protein
MRTLPGYFGAKFLAIRNRGYTTVREALPKGRPPARTDAIAFASSTRVSGFGFCSRSFHSPKHLKQGFYPNPKIATVPVKTEGCDRASLLFRTQRRANCMSIGVIRAESEIGDRGLMLC